MKQSKGSIPLSMALLVMTGAVLAYTVAHTAPAAPASPDDQLAAVAQVFDAKPDASEAVELELSSTSLTVSISDITADSAAIAWSTGDELVGEELTDVQIDYGVTVAFGSSIPADTVVISSLSPNTLYHYRVRSRDGEGKLVQSPSQTFMTLSASTSTSTAPLILILPADASLELATSSSFVEEGSGE